MAFNQFTNLDFNDIREQIKDYLRSNSNFTDFDFEGSNFSILIDTLAYNSYITAYNTNMAVNESFIDSATLRENVVSLARNIGYVPRSKKSATARITFSAQVNARSVTLKKGVVALGGAENSNYIFSIPEDITASPNSQGVVTFSNIEIFEGNLLKKTFVIDDSQPDQKYILPTPNIDTSTIRVRSVGTAIEEYTPYTNIFNVNSDTRLYLVQEISDEKYQILFGDNILGKRPANGAKVEVTYIETSGEAANGASNFTFSGQLVARKEGKDRNVTNNISAITTLQAAEQGDDIEDIDTIKYLAPRVYASQYRAVTADDYTSLIPFLYPNVESVSAYGGEDLDPPQYGKVFITIKPKNGDFLSDIAKDNIKSKLKEYTIAGIRQEFLDLKYLYVEYDSTVSYDPGTVTNTEDLFTRVTNAIVTYSKSTDINSFGGRLKYSKLLRQIDNVDTGITSNITNLVMRRNLVPAYNALANYELCYANAFHAEVEGFNLRSSGFTVSGISGTCFLTDVPNTDITIPGRPQQVTPKTGSISIFKFNEEREIVNVIENAGTVDYVKGEIILFPINISSTVLDNRIEIGVTPESNDIVAKENLYIVLDTTGKSILTLKEDLITSGSNRSGTNYIPPSSFTSSRKFTR
tara:strand:- start:20260 stop:22170 length:1911 start_codon:yes stop_codon:yes gene_type:complete